jgi:hypothetical protein
MSVLSHKRVIRGTVIPTSETGELPTARRESRWKLHLGQIADSTVRAQVQGLRRAMGTGLNTPLGR